MQSFFTITGTISDIRPSGECSLLMTAEDAGGGAVHLLIDSSTYVVDMEELEPGEQVLAYCDANAPVPLIYPPRYRPLLMLEPEQGVSYDLDVFDSRLINSTGSLQLHIGSGTKVILPNGQRYSGSLENKILLAEYKASTRSIPAQTTPERIIVFCFDFT